MVVQPQIISLQVYLWMGYHLIWIHKLMLVPILLVKWLDVSGNGLQFLSYGTALSLTSLGGYQAFQFNNSGYFQCNDKFGSVNIGGDCTIVMWVWCSEGGSYRKRYYF